MRRFADEKIAVRLDAELAEPVDFLHQAERVDDDAVADDAELAFAEDARRHQVQDIFLFADEDGVAGVVAALSADDDIRPLGQHIDDFAFAFIAPLGAHENRIGHSLICAPALKSPEM